MIRGTPRSSRRPPASTIARAAKSWPGYSSSPRRPSDHAFGETMSNRAKTEYRYEKLTWPEINDAVDLGKVCIVPCGAVEQHGPHLPLDVDLMCPNGIAYGAGKEIPDKMLVLPIVAYGY